MTLTETVHDEPAAPGDAANVPPERPMLLPRAVAVGVALPQVPHDVGARSYCDSSRQAVKKPVPDNELPVFGFVIVKLNVLLAFNAMALGLKLIVTVGGATTKRLAVAVLPIPPSVKR